VGRPQKKVYHFSKHRATDSVSGVGNWMPLGAREIPGQEKRNPKTTFEMWQKTYSHLGMLTPHDGFEVVRNGA
jgi:hypothetical protein